MINRWCITLQKWKCCFNSGWVISLAAALPNNVNTRNQLHYWSTIGLLCNFRHADGKQLSQVT